MKWKTWVVIHGLDTVLPQYVAIAELRKSPAGSKLDCAVSSVTPNGFWKISTQREELPLSAATAE